MMNSWTINNINASLVPTMLADSSRRICDEGTKIFFEGYGEQVDMLTEGSRKILEVSGEVDSGSLFLYPKVRLYINNNYNYLFNQKLLELKTPCDGYITSCDETETQLDLTNESSKM